MLKSGNEYDELGSAGTIDGSEMPTSSMVDRHMSWTISNNAASGINPTRVHKSGSYQLFLLLGSAYWWILAQIFTKYAVMSVLIKQCTVVVCQTHEEVVDSLSVTEISKLCAHLDNRCNAFGCRD